MTYVHARVVLSISYLYVWKKFSCARYYHYRRDNQTLDFQSQRSDYNLGDLRHLPGIFLSPIAHVACGNRTSFLHVQLHVRSSCIFSHRWLQGRMPKCPLIAEGQNPAKAKNRKGFGRGVWRPW